MNTKKLVESMSITQVVAWSNLLDDTITLREVGWSEDAQRVALVGMLNSKLAEQCERSFTVVLTNDELSILQDGDRDVRNFVIEQILEQT